MERFFGGLFVLAAVLVGAYILGVMIERVYTLVRSQQIVDRADVTPPTGSDDELTPVEPKDE